MFAGIDFQEGQTLEEDIAIPIIDLRFHHSDKEPFTFLWDEYTWNSNFMMLNQLGSSGVEVACPGFGATANSFLPVMNVKEWNALPDDLNMHRSKDPGAGAFSPYCRRKATATRDISAGEEFFVDYGEHWFVNRAHLGPIPLTEDLSKGTRLFQRFVAMKKNLMDSVPDAVFHDLWDTLIRRSTYTASRVIGGFHHDDPEELDILEKKNMTLTQLRIEQGIRPTAWLEEHGTCADHIEARPSTIPQAGRGAFTRRFLPKGTIIAQMPLIHILDKSLMEMYHPDEQGRPNSQLGIAGRQLLTNYCYGHVDSTILLCPYGPLVNFINHNQTLVNVKIQWSDPRKGNHNPALLDEELDMLNADATAKLAFEIVALRDLHPDEEIFLDYGDAWELAWKQHIQNWQPEPGANDYASAVELNKNPIVSTEFEILDNLSLRRDNVALYCYGVFKDRVEEWQQHEVEGTLDAWVYRMATESSTGLTRCDNIERVLSKATGKWLYRAVMWDAESQTYTGTLRDVPRAALVYLDRPYTADIHLGTSFRKSIDVPDHMFPPKWRNIA
jgi:hypothetical protein